MLIIHGFIGILIVMLILFFGWCCGILFCYYVPWEKTPSPAKQPRKQAMPVVATTDKPQIAHPVVTQLEMPCEMIQ